MCVHLQAVRIKDLSVIDWVEAGSDELNVCDSYGYTPLHYAAKYGHFEVFQKLLQKNPSKFKMTAIV